MQGPAGAPGQARRRPRCPRRTRWKYTQETKKATGMARLHNPPTPSYTSQTTIARDYSVPPANMYRKNKTGAGPQWPRGAPRAGAPRAACRGETARSTATSCRAASPPPPLRAGNLRKRRTARTTAETLARDATTVPTPDTRTHHSPTHLCVFFFFFILGFFFPSFFLEVFLILGNGRVVVCGQLEADALRSLRRDASLEPGRAPYRAGGGMVAPHLTQLWKCFSSLRGT